MKYISMLKDTYQGVFRVDRIMNAVEYILLKEGLSQDNTLFANSTCPDEINRFILSFAERWGENFALGGLAGFPFTGFTGFKAFSSHAPDGGSLFILYASHIGLSEDGELGRIKRRGMSKETYSCGSSMSALENFRSNVPVPEHDYQQNEIINFMHGHSDLLGNDDFTLDQLPEVIFSGIDEAIRELVESEKEKKVYLLGGIQINTHFLEMDYFVPKVFEVYDPEKGKYQTFFNQLMKMLDYAQL